jgi:hypothetical protein
MHLPPESAVNGHVHPRGRATTWTVRTLLAHLRDGHGFNPPTRNIIRLEREHASEHPEMDAEPQEEKK